MDQRSAYRGQTIKLELHESDVSGAITSVDNVMILQDKELCYSNSSITMLSPGVWEVTIDTNYIDYIGTFHDRWILNSGSGGSFDWVEKTFNLSEIATASTVRSVASDRYYSKDLLFQLKPNGDLYRIYDEDAIVKKIKAVILTVRGSLFHEPTYGCGLYSLLFSTSPTIADEIATEIEQQLAMQVSQIQVQSVIVTQIQTNMYEADVRFYVVNSSTPQELLSSKNIVSLNQVAI